MRGFRFQASLGFELESETFKAMKNFDAIFWRKFLWSAPSLSLINSCWLHFGEGGLASMIESQAYDYLPDMAASQDELNRLFDLETDFTFESSEQAWAALIYSIFKYHGCTNKDPYYK